MQRESQLTAEKLCEWLQGRFPYYSVITYGETWWTSTTSQCGEAVLRDAPTEAARFTVEGYNLSSLPGHNLRWQIVMRPWFQAANGCFPFPPTINPPYDPVQWD